MFRRVIAGLILGPALLLGSFAWWGFLALRTVFDEDRSRTIAEELLDNDEVVDQVGSSIGTALERTVGTVIELSDEEVAASVDVILATPAVREAIIGAFGTTHRSFLGLDDTPARIDLGPALLASQETIGIFRPDIAAALPSEFVIDLPTERIPNASPVKTFLERVVPLLAAMAVTMALMAFLTTSDRSQVLGKAARWAIGTTAFYLIVGLGVPFLLRLLAPDGAEVLAAFLTAILRAALLPSIVLGAVGAVLLLLSMFWPDPGSSRNDRSARRRERTPTAAPAAPAPAARRDAPPRRETAPAPPGPAPGSSVGRPAAPRPTPDVDATSALPAQPVAPPMPTPAPPPIGADPGPVAERPVTPSTPPAADPGAPFAPPRPTLPTRAKPPEAPLFPSWTGDAAPPADEPSPATGGDDAERPRWRKPTWVEGHGWVMDPDDPREPPNNARFVEGVGWVVPGPPPDRPDGVS